MNDSSLLELMEEINDYEKRIYVLHNAERYWKEIQMDVSLYLLAWDDFKTQQLKGTIVYKKSFVEYEFQSFIPIQQTSVIYIPFITL